LGQQADCLRIPDIKLGPESAPDAYSPQVASVHPGRSQYRPDPQPDRSFPALKHIDIPTHQA